MKSRPTGAAYILFLFALLISASLMSGTVEAVMVQEVRSGDPGVSDWTVAGWDTEIGFVAEGRNVIETADFELSVGKNTNNSSDFSTAEYSWGNGISHSFSLTYDGTEAVFTVGSTAVTWNSFSIIDEFDGLTIRTSTIGKTSVIFDSLMLGSDPLGGYSNVNTTPRTDPRIVEWLLISGAGDLSGGFTLSGDVTFSWDSDEATPTKGHLAFQIKGADAPVVPIPGAVWLLASGLIGLAVIRRRVKK